MGYLKEKSSKINQQRIIKNAKVQNYLKKCLIPNSLEDIVELDIDEVKFGKSSLTPSISNEIKHVIAIDGGYQIVEVDSRYPSSKFAFYNVGYIEICLEKIKEFEKEQIIDPDDFHQSKTFGDFQFVLPVENINLKGGFDFKNSVRKTVYEEIFLPAKIGDFKLIDTLKWLVFEEYDGGNGLFEIRCANDSCSEKIVFRKKNKYDDENNDITVCPKCDNMHYITDIFELHTLIDDFNGANSIVSYVMSAFETVLLFTIYKILYLNKKEVLPNILFIKDGPLALFSRLDDFQFKKVRPFIKFLNRQSRKEKRSYVNFVGLDKSGLFVDHFKKIEYKIENSTLIIPDISYIKKYITGETHSLFGYKTYYGRKMMFKADEKLAFVFDLPLPYLTQEGEPKDYERYFLQKAKPSDFINIGNIIKTLIDMKCDLYDNSFLPIALINRAVSISQNPGARLLKIFANENIDST